MAISVAITVTCLHPPLSLPLPLLYLLDPQLLSEAIDCLTRRQRYTMSPVQLEDTTSPQDPGSLHGQK